MRDEEQVLESLLASMSRGPLAPDAWDKVYVDVLENARLSELGVAFETVAQSKRLKAAPPAAAAEFFFQAGRYFEDVLGDQAGALGYLERAVAFNPNDPRAVERIERLLTTHGELNKLGELLASIAPHHPRGEQAATLRRAADFVMQAGNGNDRAIELLQQAARLDPQDDETRERLEQLHVTSNRIRDAVRLNEQALAADPQPNDATRKKLLGRIIELYDGKLSEPERAIPYVEQLLALDPSHEGARRSAQRLLGVKALAGRAASALALAAESFGTPEELAEYIGIALQNTRGRQRANVLARLARFKQERMGDDEGAFNALEQAIAIDPSDDGLRRVFVALATKLRRAPDAAKVLGRVVANVKEPARRAIATAQLGEMLLESGDVKRATATLNSVLVDDAAPPEAVLASAYRIRTILEAERNASALLEVLERIAALESDVEAGRKANEALAELATTLGDVPRAIAAYERLISTAARGRALAALTTLYEASGDASNHARVLQASAEDAADGALARERLLRAAHVWIYSTKDTDAGIRTCQALIERFGPTSDALALLVPALAKQRRWHDLSAALVQQAELTSGAEHAKVMARLGLVRMTKLDDPAGAIDAFAEALHFDPREKDARAGLVKLATSGEQPLVAARALDPFVRREGDQEILLVLLDVRGRAEPELDARLAALRECAEVAAASGASGRHRAESAISRGLAEVVAAGGPVEDWLARLQEILGPGGEARFAATLSNAIGDLAISSETLSLLARRAAEAYAACGDAAAAIALYQRALVYEPTSADLLSRIDGLLRQRGTPADRVALYQGVLDRGDSAWRQGMLHRIATIQRLELADAEAAIATGRTLLEHDADDAVAFALMIDLLWATEGWGELQELVEGQLARTRTDDEQARTLRAKLVEIATKRGDERLARQHCRPLLEDPRAAPEHLETLEAAANWLDDLPMLRAIFHRRADGATLVSEQVGWLDRLGRLAQVRAGDPDAAAAAWKRAAALAQGAGDEATARDLYRRAREVAPDDEETVARLTSLCERHESWAELVVLYEWLADHATEDPRRAELWLRIARIRCDRLGEPDAALRFAARAFALGPTSSEALEAFERMSIAAGASLDFVSAVDAVLALLGSQGAADATQARLRLAKARVHAVDPESANAAAAVYRSLLDDSAVEPALQLEALHGLIALVDRAPDSESRRADRRWAFDWHARHASAAEDVETLIAWARDEETRFADAAHALVLYRRALAIDPARDEVLRAVARLALASGDTDEALAALRRRREGLDEGERIAVDLDVVELEIAKAGRWSDAAAWGRAEELGRRLSQPDRVAALYEEALSHPLVSNDASWLGERAVRFCEEWFDDSRRLVRLLGRVLELSPQADWAFDRLRLVFDAEGRWDELFTLYDRALAAVTPTRRAALLEDAAQAAKDFARRPDLAIGYLEQLRHLKPQDAKLAGSLERLYARYGRHRELVALLTDRLVHLDAQDAHRSRIRIALLWLDELGDPDAAIGAIEPMRTALPDVAPQGDRMAEAVRGVLERLLSATADSGADALVPEPPPPTFARQRAAEWLRHIYCGSGHEADLARVLQIVLESLEAPGERSRLHTRIAELYEALGDHAQALDQRGACLLLDPSDEARRAKLVAIAESTGRFDRLAELLVAAAGASRNPAVRVDLTIHAALVLADRVGDAAGAIDLLSSVLSEPDLANVDALVAARRLESLLESAGRAGEQLDVIERIASIESDVAPRSEALARAARLATQLGDDVRAVRLWESQLAMDGRASMALDGLVPLLERVGGIERLAQVLMLRAQATDDRDRQRADRVRAAILVGDTLQQPDEAIAMWRAIESDFGEADDAVLALIALLETTRHWDELASTLERSAHGTPDEATRAERWRRLGDLRRDQLGQPVAAVVAYANSLATDPRNSGARAGLLALTEDEAHRRQALDALLAALRDCQDWNGIVHLTSRRLTAAATDGDQVGILREAATLAEERTGDLRTAFRATVQAFDLTPGDDEVHRHMVRLAEATDAWPAVVDAYRRAVERLSPDEPALVVELRARLAATLEARIADPQGALAAYLEVVHDSFSPRAALEAIRIAGRLGRWPLAAGAVFDLAGADAGTAVVSELLDAYERAADDCAAWEQATLAFAEADRSNGSDRIVMRDLEARLARWHRDRRGDPGAAEAALGRALSHDENNASLLRELVELRRRSRGRPLVESLLRLSRTSSGDLPLLIEAAQAAHEAMDLRPLRRGILEELLGVVRARSSEATWDAETQGLPSCTEWALEALARVHEEEGQWPSVVEILAGASAYPLAPQALARMRRRAAHIAIDALGDHERAIALYVALLDDDPRDEDAAERLAALYDGLVLTAPLLALRERQIASSSDLDRRLGLRLGLAQLLLAGGERERVVETLRANLAESPRHWPTVDELASVLEGAGRVRELVELLADRATLARDAGFATRAADLWARAAVLAQERLGDLSMAEGYHARVVELEARPASVGALARLAAARGDSASAGQWLERLLEIESDPEARAQTILRVTDILARGGNAARAITLLRQEIATASQPERLRDRLASLYRDGGDWEHLAETLSDSAAVTVDADRRLRHLLEASELWMGRCDRPDKAIPLLEQAREWAPDDISVRLKLAGALGSAGRSEAARDVLRSVLDGFGGRRPKERAGVHQQCARLELAMGNRGRALDELEAARRIDPQSPDILTSLAELARDDGQLDRAEKSYRSLLLVLRRGDEEEPATMARSEVLLELSVIAARQADPDRAGELLESALEAAAQADFELDRLESALRKRGDSGALVRLLDAKADRLGNAPALANVVAETVGLLLDRAVDEGSTLDAIRRAVARCESLYAVHPADPEVWQPLAATYRRLGEWRKLVDLLSNVVDAVDDVNERTKLRWERARVLVEELRVGDDEATPILREIVEDDPGHPEAGDMLAGALERAGARDELIELLRRRLEAAKDRSDADGVASLALRLGLLIVAHDPAEARNLFNIGLDWDGTSGPLLDALILLLDAPDDAAERADLMERRLALEEGAAAEEMASSLFALRVSSGDERAAQRAVEMGLRACPASSALRAHLENISVRERRDSTPP